ncbi:ATP-binding cassette domain-containing protein [Rhodococcus rhodnii]|uniref:ATP-binding cassette domain-containing protein n=1 Tax=Rhodococcus rhodnii TaxID=38312 RepID=UPI00068722E4|nr:ATP-binding cassette domain-containing protein [Rhodococcus rhodnii]
MSKRYGRITVLDDVSFTACPGRVTALIGRPGAGKSLVLRTAVGHVRPSRGSALVDGRPVLSLTKPAATLGAVLRTARVHENWSARNYLGWIADLANLPAGRVHDVLARVDLAYAQGDPVTSFSTPMLHRLALAGALLGDPRTLVVDEVDGFVRASGDQWMCSILRQLADDGRTVLVAARDLGSVVLVADDLVVVEDGRVVATHTVDDHLARTGTTSIRIASPEAWRLQEALHIRGVAAAREHDPASPARAALVVAAGERRTVAALADEIGVDLGEMSLAGVSADTR